MKRRCVLTKSVGTWFKQTCHDGYTSLYHIVGKIRRNRTGFFENVIKFEQIIRPG